MSKDFQIIYKMLKTLRGWRGRENFSVGMISAEKYGIAFEDWEQIVIELQRNGYIDGVVYTQNLSDKFPHIAEPITPRITLKGMEYLEENSFMKKAGEALKMLGEYIP